MVPTKSIDFLSQIYRSYDTNASVNPSQAVKKAFAELSISPDVYKSKSKTYQAIKTGAQNQPTAAMSTAAIDLQDRIAAT